MALYFCWKLILIGTFRPELFLCYYWQSLTRLKLIFIVCILQLIIYYMKLFYLDEKWYSDIYCCNHVLPERNGYGFYLFLCSKYQNVFIPEPDPPYFSFNVWIMPILYRYAVTPNTIAISLKSSKNMWGRKINNLRSKIIMSQI